MTETLEPRPFWFLRHGQTDWNKDNLSQGAVDIPLNQTGLDQASAAAQTLRGRSIARIVCSPLIRARVTADIVAAVLNLPVREQPGLHEASFGIMEGEKMLAPWFADWIDGISTPEGAEPFAALQHRIALALNQVLRAEPTLPLIVAHGAMFRAIRRFMGFDPHERLMNAVPLFCVPQAGTWSIVAANDA